MELNGKETDFKLFPCHFVIKLKDFLIKNSPLLDDWKTLLENLDFNLEEYLIIKSKHEVLHCHPVDLVIDSYKSKPGSTIENFLAALKKLKRPDIEEIIQKIEAFLEECYKKNHDEKDSSEQHFLQGNQTKNIYQVDQEDVGCCYHSENTSNSFVNYPHLYVNCDKIIIENGMNIQDLYSSQNNKLPLNSFNEPTLTKKGFECEENLEHIDYVPTSRPHLSYPHIPRFNNYVENISPKVIKVNITNQDKINFLDKDQKSKTASLLKEDPVLRTICIIYCQDVEKRVSWLYNFIKEKFKLNVKLIGEYNRIGAENIMSWVDNLIERVDLVIVAISPKYKEEVESMDNNSIIRYFNGQLQNHYYINKLRHIKARVLYFDSNFRSFTPLFLASAMPFYCEKVDDWCKFCKMLKQCSENN